MEVGVVENIRLWADRHPSVRLTEVMSIDATDPAGVLTMVEVVRETSFEQRSMFCTMMNEPQSDQPISS
eukprot:CAMPEP_0174762082 /NCGR_PEP_ID=MMETSP1094-20130205/109601_1 /TAXON_ID=156173 /ORGANISM="Chrysochromulina brevifilum, Strain UTEX LB 985" /LENGTH=68 /DNA_ID=CAMNT_0015968033 /DNA_START=702 /DNA_END=906 /DNA_ORIENTATION=+